MIAYVLWAVAFLCMMFGNYTYLSGNTVVKEETLTVYIVVDKDGNFIWEGYGIRPDRQSIRAIAVGSGGAGDGRVEEIKP